MKRKQPCIRFKLRILRSFPKIITINPYTSVRLKGGLKSSYNDVISVGDDFFDQRDPSTGKPMKGVCGPQAELGWKINLIWSYFMYLGQSLDFSDNPHNAVKNSTDIYLPTTSARAGYDTRSIFKVEFNRFEFRVFLFLD